MNPKAGDEQQPPPHPGAILASELAAIAMNGSQLAERIQVPKNRIYQILDGRRAITADTALRLGRFFGTGPDRWLSLQQAYELAQAHAALNLEAIQPYRRVEPRKRLTPEAAG